VEIDEWSTPAWALSCTFFGDINGIPLEELGNAVRGSAKARRQSALPANPPASCYRGSSAG
jgi:hypothetical protein